MGGWGSEESFFNNTVICGCAEFSLSLLGDPFCNYVNNFFLNGQPPASFCLFSVFSNK